VVVAAFTAIDGLWVTLSVVLGVLTIGLLFVFARLAGTLRRLSSLIQGLEGELLPLIAKAGGSVDRVNTQLDKLDHVTDSAVNAADNLDTAVRAVTLAVTRPVQKVSGFAAGIANAFATLRARRDVGAAVDAGREAAARRERDIAEELGRP
jgi:hypothetical protein